MDNTETAASASYANRMRHHAGQVTAADYDLPQPAHILVRVRVRVRVENLLSQRYLLNRDVLFSYHP